MRAERAQQGDRLLAVRHVRLSVKRRLVANHVDPELLRQRGDPAMLERALPPQLGHQAEQRQLALARQRGQRAHRRGGGRGVRVEAVDDQERTAGDPLDLHPPRRAPALLQRGGDGVERDVAPERDRRRRQRVRDLLRAAQRQPDVGPSPRRRQAEARSQLTVERDVVGPTSASPASAPTA